MHEFKKRARMTWHDRRGRGALFELVHFVEETIDICKAIYGNAIYGNAIYGEAIYSNAIGRGRGAAAAIVSNWERKLLSRFFASKKTTFKK